MGHGAGVYFPPGYTTTNREAPMLPRSRSDAAPCSTMNSQWRRKSARSGGWAVRRSNPYRILVFLISLGLAPAWAGAQTVQGTLPVGTLPLAVAVNPVTKKVYVVNNGVASVTDNVDGSVTVFDDSTHTTATVPVGSHPFAVVVNSATN